jgi:hypothetical protein
MTSGRAAAWAGRLVVLALGVSVSIASCTSGSHDPNTPSKGPAGAPRLIYERTMAGENHEIGTLRIDGSDRRSLVSVTQSGAPFVETSPDGRFMVVATAGLDPRLVTVDLANNRRLASTRAAQPPGQHPTVTWAPGAATIDYNDDRGDVFLIDVASGRTNAPTGMAARAGHFHPAATPGVGMGTRFCSPQRAWWWSGFCY